MVQHSAFTAASALASFNLGLCYAMVHRGSRNFFLQVSAIRPRICSVNLNQQTMGQRYRPQSDAQMFSFRTGTCDLSSAWRAWLDFSLSLEKCYRAQAAGLHLSGMKCGWSHLVSSNPFARSWLCLSHL